MSEKRWVQLIDQARLEASHWRKKYEDTTRKQSDQIDTLHNQLVKLQDNFTTAKTTLDHKNEMVHTEHTTREYADSTYDNRERTSGVEIKTENRNK